MAGIVSTLGVCAKLGSNQIKVENFLNSTIAEYSRFTMNLIDWVSPDIMTNSQLF